MVRLNQTVWLKCGIELVEGVQQISAVVTRDYSDWSVVPMPGNPAAIWLRLTRKGSAIEIYYSLDGKEYIMLRMAYLTSVEAVDVGVMCASPDGKGFLTTFKQFEIQSLHTEKNNFSQILQDGVDSKIELVLVELLWQ